MANLTDIEYVTHDMIRTISHSKDLPLPVAIEVRSPDYLYTYELEKLDKQPQYGWQTMQANTFLSNVLCLPTEKEKDTMPTAKDRLAKVKFLPTADLVTFRKMEDEFTKRMLASSVRGEK